MNRLEHWTHDLREPAHAVDGSDMDRRCPDSHQHTVIVDHRSSDLANPQNLAGVPEAGLDRSPSSCSLAFVRLPTPRPSVAGSGWLANRVGHHGPRPVRSEPHCRSHPRYGPTLAPETTPTGRGLGTSGVPVTLLAVHAGSRRGGWTFRTGLGVVLQTAGWTGVVSAIGVAVHAVALRDPDHELRRPRGRGSHDHASQRWTRVADRPVDGEVPRRLRSLIGAPAPPERGDTGRPPRGGAPVMRWWSSRCGLKFSSSAPAGSVGCRRAVSRPAIRVGRAFGRSTPSRSASDVPTRRSWCCAPRRRGRRLGPR